MVNQEVMNQQLVLVSCVLASILRSFQQLFRESESTLPAPPSSDIGGANSRGTVTTSTILVLYEVHHLPLTGLCLELVVAGGS